MINQKVEESCTGKMQWSPGLWFVISSLSLGTVGMCIQIPETGSLVTAVLHLRSNGSLGPGILS